MNDLSYLNAFNKITNIGPQKLRKIAAHFPSFEAAWRASHGAFLQAGLSPKVAQNIAQERNSIEPSAEWKKVELENIVIVTESDNVYPALLKQTAHPPYFLYCRGTREINDPTTLAVVGSRKFTDYGKRACYRLCFDLAKAGVTIVSGLAFGIDATAHRAALDAHGKTIAVLGNSCDDHSLAPRFNRTLAHEIIEKDGALLSEYAPPTPPSKGSFPTRNRIMAGMSLGVLVVEAAHKSGSLITANWALEENRDVFSVPGSIFSTQSAGTNQLVKSGAKIVTHAGDILEELHLEKKKVAGAVKKTSPQTPEEEKILAALQHESEAVHVDRIIKLTKLDTTVASATLTILEMKGALKNTGGQNYIAL